MSRQAESVFFYWKKSLSLFQKDQLNLYFLGTLATFIRASKLALRHFWWLLPIDALCTTLLSFSPNLYLNNLNILTNTLTIVFSAYIAALITRPSLEPKGVRYYTKYSTGLFACIFFACNPFIFFMPVLVVLLFFFFDTNLSAKSFLKSVVQTSRSLWYFWPAHAIVLLSLMTILFFLFAITLLILPLIFGAMLTAVVSKIIFHPLMLLLIFSSFSVLYIKLKHEYFGLLFN